MIRRDVWLWQSRTCRDVGFPVANCEGFRMPAATEIAACSGGRRPKASKGGNRGKGYVRPYGVRYRELSTARNFDFEAG